MTTKQHNATVPLSATEVKKLLRAWGWRPSGEGRNHVKWVKGSSTIAVRNAGKGVTYEPLREAARVEGLSFDEWRNGPPQEQTPTAPQLSEEDMTWFLDANFVKLEHPDDKERYRRIRRVLEQQDLLDHYTEIKNLRRREEAQRERRQMAKTATRDKPATPSTPPPAPRPAAHGDSRVMLTLDQALAIRGAKQNTLYRSSCEIIAALAVEGPITDDKGGATARLLEKLPIAQRSKKPLGMTGLSGQLKQWDEAGLIQREIRGKRCYKIELTADVKLSSKEQRRYLLNPVTGAPIRPAEEKPAAPAPTPADPPESAPVAPAAAPEPVTPTTAPEPIAATVDGDPAIAVLRAELALAQSELDFYKGRVAGLERAIDILQKADSP